MKKNYVNTDEVPQDVIQNEGGGGGCKSTAESGKADNSLLYVVGFLLGLVILAAILAII